MQGRFGPEREAVIGRELTKLHESVYRGTLAELAAALGSSIPLLGEFVIVVAGAQESPAAASEVGRVYALLAAAVAPDLAVRLCAEITGASRNEVYALTRNRD